MNLSDEETGRNKTSRVILLAPWERERALSCNMNLSWSVALWCWPKKRKWKRGENWWKNSLVPLPPVAQYSQLRTGWSWPGGKCVSAARRKGFLARESRQMIYMLKQTAIVFLLPLVPGLLLTLLPWWLPLSTSLCSALKPLRWRKAIIPSSPMEVAWCAMQWCGLLFFILHYMGSLNLLLLLTDWPVARTITLPFGAKLPLPGKCNRMRAYNIYTDEYRSSGQPYCVTAFDVSFDGWR